MKKIISLIFCSLCIQLSCFAGSSASVHVSVTIPPLPQVQAQNSSNQVSVNTITQVTYQGTMTTKAKVVREGKIVLMETCVAR